MIHSSHWREIAVARAKDIRARTVFSAATAAGAWWVAPGPWPLAWLAATLCVQFASLLITEPVRHDADFKISPARRAALFATIPVSSAVFAAIAPYCWFNGGWGGQLFGCLILAGGAINVAMQARAWAPMLWLGNAPFLALLPALPLISLASQKGAPRAAMALSACAGALFVVHLVAAGRRSIEQGAALSRALDDAERQRRRAEEASAIKSEFLALMSHEIRTPLNGVLGMAQAMAADRLAQTQKERLQVLRRSGESLLALLNDLLDLSEVVAGKLKLNSGVVEPETVAAQAEAAFGALAVAKGIGFVIRFSETGRSPRAGDPVRVRQVLHQLADNAVKFTEAGQVTITIDGSAEALVFEVADTGQGIAAERLPTIFERFNQADGSATRRHGGSGVGLTLSRGLARLMGGDITVVSEAGQGSTFTARLALPLAAVEAATSTEASAPAAEEPAPLRVRILAAEDNPTNRMVLQTLLETVGLSAHMVENGQEAVDAWRAAHWDLILMDIQMPVMDGVTATRTIRQVEREEGRPRTPIVALTANAMSHQAAEYVAAGMDGLVPKPIEFGQLIAVIANAGDAPEEEAFRAA